MIAIQEMKAFPLCIIHSSKGNLGKLKQSRTTASSTSLLLPSSFLLLQSIFNCDQEKDVLLHFCVPTALSDPSSRESSQSISWSSLFHFEFSGPSSFCSDAFSISSSLHLRCPIASTAKGKSRPVRSITLGSLASILSSKSSHLNFLWHLNSLSLAFSPSPRISDVFGSHQGPVKIQKKPF